jgi:hydroxymethylpyrimidine/phosphomethylpyrimidine kinase
VRSQIDAVARDIDIAAVKTGMLATGDIVRSAETIGRFQRPNNVDPSCPRHT